MNILISGKTKKEIDLYITKPSPVLLLTGPEGTGKQIVTDSIIDNIFQISTPGEKALSLIDMNRNDSPVTIEEIRDLKNKLKYVESGTNVTRVIVIRNIDKINDQAQNSLLKLLEDTPKNTLFIINASLLNKVINTIQSRSMIIRIVNPTINEYQNFYNTDKLASYFIMSDGRSRFIDELVKDSSGDFLETVNIAKKYVSSDSFGKLIISDEITKKHDINLFIFGLIQIYRSLIKNTSDKARIEKFNDNLKSLADSQEFLLVSNPNIKLLMTRLAINL